MCSEYAGTLPLSKHDRLFAHAMVVVWGVTDGRARGSRRMIRTEKGQVLYLICCCEG